MATSSTDDSGLSGTEDAPEDGVRPRHLDWGELSFAFQPQLDGRKVRDLATLAFVGQKANVCLLGPPRVGKTMLAVGLAIAACQAGYSISLTTLDDMVQNLREAEATGRFAKKLQTYLKPAVLIVDEVGYLPLSGAEGNMVFQLVSRRYERGRPPARERRRRLPPPFGLEWNSQSGVDSEQVLELLHRQTRLSHDGAKQALAKFAATASRPETGGRTLTPLPPRPPRRSMGEWVHHVPPGSPGTRGWPPGC